MEPFAKRPRVEGPGSDALQGEEAITFHLIKKDPTDGAAVLDERGHFPPDMTHQLFGEKEEIVGYDGLSIDIWLSPLFQAFVDVKYAAKGPGATDLKAPFQEAFPSGFFEDKASFDKALQAEAALDLGCLGQEVACQQTGEASAVKVFRSHLVTADSKLKELHMRLQPLLLFFVDASSAIDQGDEGWHLFTAVQQGAQGVEVLGYATAYRFYHYPAGSRLRLAQILVLPPHQGRGVGALLLEAVQKMADELDACDLAFEDPAEGLQSLRTFLDARRALALDWARAAAAERIAALSGDKGKGTAAARANGSAGSKAARVAAAQHPLSPPADVLERLRKELRLSKLQAAVVWRVLLLVVGEGEEAVAHGLESLIRQQIVAQASEAKGDAQGKSVQETAKGFVMFRGATRERREVPLLPVEEQSVEQQAEAVEEATGAALQAAAAVAGKFLIGDEEEGEEGEESGDSEQD